MEALNQKERRFAEENHGLIYSFLNYYRLPEAEHYDICAIAYLQAVKEWHRKPELRDKYKFSTIAFKKMESAKIKKYHADRQEGKGGRGRNVYLDRPGLARSDPAAGKRACTAGRHLRQRPHTFQGLRNQAGRNQPLRKRRRRRKRGKFPR